jgi:hypothetical protein
MAGPNANLSNGQELVVLPLANDVPWYLYFISLSATQYVQRFRFNTRMNRWIMDIADSMNNDILDSVPLLINRNLTGQFNYLPGFPPGQFFVLDSTNQGTQPTRYSFGVDHLAYYLDPTATT